MNVDESHPHAGFFIMNNPAMEADIRNSVKKGFMVRTRSDANTVKARKGDYQRYEAAIKSEAHMISTDYYLKELSPSQDFQIVFADRSYAQCNATQSNHICKL